MASRSPAGGNRAFKENDIKYMSRRVREYLSASGKQAKHIRQKIKSFNNSEIVCRLVDEKLLECNESERIKLLYLGMVVNRQKYLYPMLLALGTNPNKIDEINFLVQLRNPTLNKFEEFEIARFIANTWDYDTRLLEFIHGDNLEMALDGIYQDAKGHVLKDKQLFALSKSEKYMRLLQDRIRDAIDMHPVEKKKWIRYLDLTCAENQAVIVRHYDLVQIYYALKDCLGTWCNSEYCQLRVPMKMICNKDLTREEKSYLRTVLLQKIEQIERIESDRELVAFIKALGNLEREFGEMLLIIVYTKTECKSKLVLQALIDIESDFAYKELVSGLLRTEMRSERFKLTKLLLTKYQSKREKICMYVRGLEDIELLKYIDSNFPPIDISQYSVELPMTYNYAFRLIEPTEKINEMLPELAKKIDAHTFLAAVGFTFSSGIRLLQPLIDHIAEKSERFEFVVGSLQTAVEGKGSNKIDKHTVIRLNELIKRKGLKLFTYEPKFYHGKFYCVANSDKAYFIIGSSNISKTAYFDNYELNLLLEVDISNGAGNIFFDWFEGFKRICTPLDELNEQMFTNLNWESELSAYSEKFVRNLSQPELQRVINELSDLEVKERLEMWVKHKPVHPLTVHNIDALKDYILLFFPQRGLAVFEAYKPNNAYYIFRCDNIDNLIAKVSQMSKSEMTRSCLYVKKGNHIEDKKRLNEIIQQFFVTDQYYDISSAGDK